MLELSLIRPKHFLHLPLFASILACIFLFVSPFQVFAVEISLDDQAHVLNSSKIQQEASQFQNTVFIYTTTSFSGDQKALDQATQQRLPDQESIGIGIDVKNKHISIQAGSNVILDHVEEGFAIDAFHKNMRNNDYTSATIATLHSLLNMYNSDENIEIEARLHPGNPGNALFILLIIMIILVVFIALLIRVLHIFGDARLK